MIFKLFYNLDFSIPKKKKYLVFDNLRLKYFKYYLGDSLNVINKLLNDNVFNHISIELVNYYFSPGNIYNLYHFANSNNLDIKQINLETFLQLLIKNNFFKKETSMRYIFFDYIEMCLKKISTNMNNDSYNYFIKKIDDIKKFNLDEEAFFIEFQDKILNG